MRTLNGQIVLNYMSTLVPREIYSFVGWHKYLKGNNMPIKKRLDYKERQKYACHKSKAKSRGIEFNLTYEEWWDIWEKSGKWAQRGAQKGCYVMSRKNDMGAYEIGNVFIQTHEENRREAMLGKPASYVRTPAQRLAQIKRVNPQYKEIA